MYEFLYDYIKPKYGDKAKVCYMDTDSFLFILKLKIFIKILLAMFDTSNFDERDNRPLPIGKNKKVIGLLKEQLGGKIMKEFCALRAKTYAYSMDDDSERKKPEEQKMCNKT